MERGSFVIEEYVMRGHWRRLTFVKGLRAYIEWRELSLNGRDVRLISQSRSKHIILHPIGSLLKNWQGGTSDGMALLRKIKRYRDILLLDFWISPHPLKSPMLKECDRLGFVVENRRIIHIRATSETKAPAYVGAWFRRAFEDRQDKP